MQSTPHNSYQRGRHRNGAGTADPPRSPPLPPHRVSACPARPQANSARRGGSLGRLRIDCARGRNAALPNCRWTSRRPKDGGGSKPSGKAARHTEVTSFFPSGCALPFGPILVYPQPPSGPQPAHFRSLSSVWSRTAATPARGSPLPAGSDPSGWASLPIRAERFSHPAVPVSEDPVPGSVHGLPPRKTTPRRPTSTDSPVDGQTTADPPPGSRRDAWNQSHSRISRTRLRPLRTAQRWQSQNRESRTNDAPTAKRIVICFSSFPMFAPGSFIRKDRPNISGRGGSP